MRRVPLSVGWRLALVGLVGLFFTIGCDDLATQGDGDDTQTCKTDEDCPEGTRCSKAGICVSITEPDGDDPPACTDDEDCADGYHCEAGICHPDAADGDEPGDGDTDGDEPVDGDADGDDLLLPAITVPQTVDLPPLLADQSISRALVITSSGSAPLTISGIKKLEGGSRDISLLNLPTFPLELQPEEVYSLTIRYEQANIGYDEAYIKITSDAVNKPEATIHIRSVQRGTPNLRCEPSPLDFGRVDIRQHGGQRQIITCHNDRVNDDEDNILELSSLALYPPSTTAFSIPNDVPNSMFIRSGEQVEIPVVFTPVHTSQESAAIHIFHNSSSSDSPLAIELTGEGGVKRLQIEPMTIAFGGVPVGLTAEATVVLRSVGDFPVRISGVERGVGLPPEFALELDGLLDDGVLTLNPGTQVEFDIVFAPQGARDYSGAVMVLSDSIDSVSGLISLSGTGANYILNFERALYEFGAVRPGQSTVGNLLLVNQGSQPAQVNSLTFSDTSGVFALSNPSLSFPFLVGAGQSSNLAVRFSPQDDVDYDCTVTLEIDSPLTPTISTELTGYGAYPLLRMEPGTLVHDFGEVNIGGSAQFQYRLINDGDIPLNLLSHAWSLTTGDPNAMIAYQVVGVSGIEPGGERLLQVSMSPPLSPSGAIPQDASRRLRLTTDDPDHAEVLLDVTGRAVSPLVAINPEGPLYDFGSLLPGYEATPIQVTLTNQGTGTLYIDDIHLTHLSHPSFWLTGLPASFPVALTNPGSSLTFTVRYRPTAFGNHAGTLRVVNRGYTQANLSVNLQGAGANCPVGTHSCSGVCVANNSVDHCGSNCTPCPQPPHSVAICAPWLTYHRCEFECLGHWVPQGEVCVPVNTDDCCGEDCEDCSLRQADYGEWVCNPAISACALDCDPFYHPGTDNCEPNMSPTCCGPHCQSCPARANADPACIGQPGMTECGIACWEDYGNCNNRTDDGCEIYLATNVNHCGACREACVVPNAIPACVGGTCQVNSCTGYWADCDGLPGNGCETNTFTNSGHCGRCDNPCTADNGVGACSSGLCVMQSCNTGWRDCNQQFDDGCETHVFTNPNHCGVCNFQCVLNHAVTGCAGGQCTVEDCADGWENCDGLTHNGCERNVNDDIYNCGGCNILCLPPNGFGLCGAGECHIQSCYGDYLDCNGEVEDGCEANINIDPRNCGGCGNACDYPNAQAVCNMRHCGMGSCHEGYRNCNGNPADGCEVHFLSDNDNCGNCGTLCRNPPNMRNTTCINGVCTPGECNPGYRDCNNDLSDGCEINTMLDPLHCGTCNNGCSLTNAVPFCDMGECRVNECVGGWDNCDGNDQTGCETRITTPSDCGVCGRVCNLPNTDAHLCVAGDCQVSTCDPDYGNCDPHHNNGCESYLVDNNVNCGSCGNDCRTPPRGTGVCNGTSCTVNSCTNGYGDCNGQFGDGCEFALNSVSNVCGSPTIIRRSSDNAAYIRGDEGNDISHEYQGVGEQWLSVYITEESIWAYTIRALVVLEVPPGVDYDIDIYTNGCGAGNKLGSVMAGGQGQTEAFTICSNDNFDNDDSFTAFFHIRFFSGSGCEPWKLKVYGYQNGEGAACGTWWFRKNGGEVVNPPDEPPKITPLTPEELELLLRSGSDAVCEEP